MGEETNFVKNSSLMLGVNLSIKLGVDLRRGLGGGGFMILSMTREGFTENATFIKTSCVKIWARLFHTERKGSVKKVREVGKEEVGCSRNCKTARENER